MLNRKVVTYNSHVTTDVTDRLDRRPWRSLIHKLVPHYPPNLIVWPFNQMAAESKAAREEEMCVTLTSSWPRAKWALHHLTPLTSPHSPKVRGRPWPYLLLYDRKTTLGRDRFPEEAKQIGWRHVQRSLGSSTSGNGVRHFRREAILALMTWLTSTHSTHRSGLFAERCCCERHTGGL